MRVKELKNLLDKMPEDTEVVFRCQLHEITSIGVKETIPIMSAMPVLTSSNKMLILNPEKPVRLDILIPLPTDLVKCTTCTKRNRLQTCIKRGRSCDECQANCDCKNCGHNNMEDEVSFVNRPHYEKDHNVK